MDSLHKYKSKGKLLFTGEYTVLDGALALAVPTQLGQSLTVYPTEEKKNIISWLAYKYNGELWSKTILDISQQKIIETNDIKIAKTLLNIFIQAKKLDSIIINQPNFGYECETHLEFPQKWGLGSSSTLINNIAKWLKISPYLLLEKTFGGSGYDLACAEAHSPITYQLQNKKPIVKEVFLPSQITDNLLFIYLNKKQDSREGINHYKNKQKSEELIEKVSYITQKIIEPNCSFKQFSELIQEHEDLISKHIQIPTIKKKLFSDYSGFIKSLGAWGGDFIMAEKIYGAENYFKNKGHKILKTYDEFLL
ncbi:GYDIA family GHMP kinase [Apibacter adventoris]|uniref:GHMP kinase n=1 Tax=Apibacter adventoris TaxID=1679466 RepID=A0A2S8AE51_9FLAO|nr:GYDIA family GHMP kinase [Apibacter adventoris]PQL93211.1 GHMP kinase [Apibacter adventoris]